MTSTPTGFLLSLTRIGFRRLPSLAEVGKVGNPIFLCEYLTSRHWSMKSYDGLQMVENWNATNHYICYGQRGELTTNSREKQELTHLPRVYPLIPKGLVDETLSRDRPPPQSLHLLCVAYRLERDDPHLAVEGQGWSSFYTAYTRGMTSPSRRPTTPHIFARRWHRLSRTSW